MNELLQKHGCSNVFTVPEGLKELASDITREVLRWQPAKMLDFIANYLSALLITREHGIMAVSILEDLCDCRATVSDHLLQIGLERPQVEELADIIKEAIQELEPGEGKGAEKIKETAILKKVLTRMPLDEEMSAKVCQVARNAYRDYWYRKAALKKGIQIEPEQAWEKAAQHTLEIYKKTKPSMMELHRATERIQAAYKGYHVRKNVLKHSMPQERKKKPNRKVDMLGPPLDIASSREIDMGPVVQIRVKEDDVGGMFDDETAENLGLDYDPMKTITHYIEPVNTVKATVVAAMAKTNPIPMDDISRASYPKSDKVKSSPGIPSDDVNYRPRISFADSHQTIRRMTDDDDLEVPEIPGIGSDPIETPAAFEVPEELAGDDYSTKMSSGTQSSRTTDVDDALDDDKF